MSAADDLVRRADEALRAGHLAEAIDGYAAALAIDPARADAWYNRGWAERSDRRFADALASYGRAIEAGIERPAEAHVNRAAILSDHLFRPDAAAAELRAALERDPHLVPAWISLGAAHEDAGRMTDARAAYCAALVLEPANGRALGRLAAIDVAEGRTDEAIRQLRAGLNEVRTADDQADMLFALGGALDSTGGFDDAFQAIEAANWLARSINPIRYVPAAQEALVDRLIRTFPGAAVTNGIGPRPVFICGLFRSGSTLAEQLLARHPAVTAGGELEAIPAIARTLQPYPEAVPMLAVGQRTALGERYLGERAALGPGLVTDKRCDNYLHLGLIKTLFPAARIIHTVRHPLDTLLSAWFLRFGDGVTWANDLSDAAHHLIHYRRLMAHWRTLWPDDIHEWSYDRAVIDPHGAMSDLLAFLDLPWDDSCLGPRGVSGPVRPASAVAAPRPLHARSSGRWRNYQHHLDPVRRALAAAGVAI